METRTLKDEVGLGSTEKGWLPDLGHPLLNRIADSFVRAAGVGATQAVSREAYFVCMEGFRGETTGLPDANTGKRSHFSSLRGDDGQRSLEAVVTSAGREAFRWGLAAGVYSGITYGIKEARGCHDWKNSAIAGAITGAAVALSAEDGHPDRIVQFAITGAALSSAANLLSGVL